jgi:hypothetical protein
MCGWIHGAVLESVYLRCGSGATNFGAIGVDGHTVSLRKICSYVNCRAKEKPGQFTFGPRGTGSITCLAGVLLNDQVGIDILHVPYEAMFH